MSLEVYSRQSKAFQYDGYKINSEMREHINAEKSSSNVHKDRDTVNFSAEGRNMCYGFGVHDVKDRAKHTVVKPGIAPLFDTISRTLKTVREAVHFYKCSKRNRSRYRIKAPNWIIKTLSNQLFRRLFIAFLGK